MSSGFENNDWMFSANNIKPWHNIGTVIGDAPNSTEAIKIAKLDWSVEQENVYNKNGDVIDNLFINVRKDTNDVLGVVRGRYNIIQNTESFNFVDNIIKNANGVECKYETAGSLFNGKRIFMLVRLPDVNLLGDEVENYLFFSNSHDGSSGLMAGISNIRVVCNNTLQLAEKGASRLWKIKHTRNLKDRQIEAENSLGLAINYNDWLKIESEKMAIQKINEETFFRNFFKELKLSEKNKEIALNDIKDIYVNKPDLQNFKKSAWGMYNAVADYVSNSEPFRKTSTMNDWKMCDWMDGYKLLETAQRILKVA